MISKQDLVTQAYPYLMALDFVKWDRWIDSYDTGNVVIFYGWIDRKNDNYKDFVHLELFAKDEGYAMAYTTSSEEKTAEINRLLGFEASEHNDCKRIEKLFPKLTNAIRLPKIYIAT